MTLADWRRVIDQAAALGVSLVQFIGGEPTLHPHLPALIQHALGRMMEVEVYTNLSHVSEEMWRVFAQPGVRLVASYYSTDAQQHDVITGRPGSHARTRANVVRALHRRIPIRIGTVEVHDDQVIEATLDELTALGVVNVRRDRVREVGRGARAAGPGIDQLCGHCMASRLAIPQQATCGPARSLDGCGSAASITPPLLPSALAPRPGGLERCSKRRSEREHPVRSSVLRTVTARCHSRAIHITSATRSLESDQPHPR
jgi:hypothetical protein